MKRDMRVILRVDRLIHEPGRLAIMAVLYAVETADFLYLLRETGMTTGNLSSHLTKLEAGGYVEIAKTYKEKIPQTTCRLSRTGRTAFQQYRTHLKTATDNMKE